MTNPFRTKLHRQRPKDLVISHLHSAVIFHDAGSDYPWHVRYDFGWVGHGARTARGAWASAWRAIANGRIPRQSQAPARPLPTTGG